MHVFLDSFIFFIRVILSYFYPYVVKVLRSMIAPSMFSSLERIECCSCLFLRLRNIYPLLKVNDFSSSYLLGLFFFS